MANIVEATACGNCYWEITSDGRLIIYGGDNPSDDGLYWLEAWDSTPPWYEYRSQIKGVNISDTVSTTTMYQAFYGCSALTEAVITGLDISACTTLRRMFSGCVNLSDLTLENFNTSNVADMSCLFYNCQFLTALDLSNFDTSGATNMSYMFYGCSALTEIDLSSFNTSSVTTMAYMFRGCSALTEIDLSSFNTSSVTTMAHMFHGCSSLTALNLTSFDVSAVTVLSYMFYQCLALTTIYAEEWTDELPSNAVGAYTFQGCYALVGAIAYDNSKLTKAYANTTTGYFTAAGADTDDTDDDATDDVTVEDGTATISGTTRTVKSLAALDIYYESASGDTVDFNGDTLWIQEPEALFKGLWEYDSYDSAYGGGKVTRFYRPVEESDEVSLEVVADSYAGYVDIVDEAHNIFESDIRNLTPGKLYINGAYRECYIHSRSYSDFDIVLASATMDVSALYTGESWIEELTLEAADIAGAATSLSDGTGIMRPADVDVSSPAGINLSLDLDYPVYPVITFYGPAESPWVTIGTEFYQCRQTIYEGEYIVYDAKNRTVTGYIESAREPDENSYSVGIPDDWEAGDTLYRVALFTTSDGGSLFIGRSSSWSSVNSSVVISDVLLSAESEVEWKDTYFRVSDIVTLGSGDENTGQYVIEYETLFDGWKSVFDSGLTWIVSGYAAEVSLVDTCADFVAEEDLSSIYLAHWYLSLEELGLADYDTAEIGFALINSDCDSVIIHVKTDTTTSGNLRLEISESDGMVSGTVDLSIGYPEYLIIYFRSSEILSKGDRLTLCCGYITGEGRYPVSGQMVYANSAVGEKNWFEYRNLDLDPFEPIQPGESTIYFESDTTFDLTVLQERSEPPWT